MARVLIAGCGYVGQATADLFHAAGWELEGWVSSPESAAKLCGKPYPVISVDIALRDQVNARPENFDAVILCASTRGGEPDVYRRLYLNGARNLLDRFVGSTVAFTSSTSVYGQQGGSWVTEESKTEPMCETGQILLETERLVLGGGGIVARLAGIYGPGRSAVLTNFWAGEASVDPGNDHFVNQVHRDDIASALFLLLDRRSSPRQIYNVVDNQPILRSECYRWLAEKLNRPLPPIGKATGQSKRGRSNKRVSNAKLRSLGWKPRYPTFAEAMGKSILPDFSQRA
ncbi:MAG: NAD-dependent epimerase/dehydratase family protein [Chthoniobacterales bacterium]